MWSALAEVVPTPVTAADLVTSAGVVVDRAIGLDQLAEVPEEAVRTWPAEGAVAAETTTTVVAVLNPEATRSSERRESFP